MAIGYVASAWVEELLSAIRELGYDTEALLKDLPGIVIGPGPHLKLEVGSARRLYHRIDQLTQDPILGVRIGKRIDGSSLGFFPVLMRHAPTLGHMLDNVVQFQWSISENGGYSVSSMREGSQLLKLFEYIPVDDAIEANRHQLMAVVTSTAALFRRTSHGQKQVAWIRIPQSLDAELTEAALGYPCIPWDGPAGFAVREQDLKTPIYSRDDALYSLVLDYALGITNLHKSRHDFISELKTLVRQHGYSAVSIVDIERLIGVHRRVIQRNLADASMSFRAVKEEVVRNEAIALLRSPKRSIDEIASRLGYSEPSAFHRAFRRWFGMTPTAFRKSESYVG